MQSNDPTRRRFELALLGALGGLALPGTSRAQLQGFPTRPMKMVVPFPAGGPTDIVARPLAALLGEALKQPVVVDNRGGAGGSIGAEVVAKAPSDGYTMLMGTVGTAAINVSLYRRLPHDPVRDFTPIALVATAPLVVVAGPSSPVDSIRDLIAAAHSKPGQISYGSAGNGTPGHLTGAMFEAAAGVKLQHIPYKGSAPAITDLLGGQIPIMFDPVQSVIQHIRSGKLRPLAVSSRTRSTVLPQVPTLAEAGLTGFESTAWWEVFAPSYLPPTLARFLQANVQKIVASKQYREKLGDLGVEPVVEQPASLAEFQRREIIKWGKAVRDSGATLD